jgi:hypothetical protein
MPLVDESSVDNFGSGSFCVDSRFKANRAALSGVKTLLGEDEET